MTQSQAVTADITTNTIFLVWQFNNTDKANIKAAFADVVGIMGNLNNSIKTRYPKANASITLGIGFDAWQVLDLPEKMPAQFEKFAPIVGDKHTAVSTAGDLHFHIRADEPSLCIDLASHISDALRGTATILEEVHGFRYWDGRSILGFVDGTENPQGDERAEFAIIGEEDADYAGGSYLFVQKYIHDMTAWRALPVHEQEKVIGRSKQDDIEMSDDVKPSNSHASLANVGEELRIVRDNMPFGSVASNEMGTYFIAYARYFSTVKLMLERMFIGEPAGNHDRILDFSTAKTGTLFFVPTLDMLDEWVE